MFKLAQSSKLVASGIESSLCDSVCPLYQHACDFTGNSCHVLLFQIGNAHVAGLV